MRGLGVGVLVEVVVDEGATYSRCLGRVCALECAEPLEARRGWITRQGDIRGKDLMSIVDLTEFHGRRGFAITWDWIGWA